MNTMAQKINNIRKQRGLSLGEFSQKIGYSYSMCEKVCYKSRKPGAAFLKRLKEEFPEVDMNDLYSV